MLPDCQSPSCSSATGTASPAAGDQRHIRDVEAQVIELGRTADHAQTFGALGACDGRIAHLKANSHRLSRLARRRHLYRLARSQQLALAAKASAATSNAYAWYLLSSTLSA